MQKLTKREVWLVVACIVLATLAARQWWRARSAIAILEQVRPMSATLRTYDAATGERLTGCAVTFSAGTSSSDIEDSGRSLPFRKYVVSTSRPDGDLTWTAVVTGPCTLTVNKDGYAGQVVTIEPPFGTVEVKLQKLKSISSAPSSSAGG